MTIVEKSSFPLDSAETFDVGAYIDSLSEVLSNDKENQKVLWTTPYGSIFVTVEVSEKVCDMGPCHWSSFMCITGCESIIHGSLKEKSRIERDKSEGVQKSYDVNIVVSSGKKEELHPTMEEFAKLIDLFFSYHMDELQNPWHQMVRERNNGEDDSFIKHINKKLDLWKCQFEKMKELGVTRDRDSK